MVLKRPLRSWRTAARYWWPRRLTLGREARIHAWFWWNF